MKEIESDDKIFRINIFLMLKNFVFVILIMAAFCIFSKTTLAVNVKIILAIAGLYFLYAIASESIVSIKINPKSDVTVFQFSRFLFYNSSLTLKANEFYYSYNEEVGARGTKQFVFIVYNLDKDKIIKIIPLSSGWSETKIFSIINLFQRMDVKAYQVS